MITIARKEYERLVMKAGLYDSLQRALAPFYRVPATPAPTRAVDASMLASDGLGGMFASTQPPHGHGNRAPAPRHPYDGEMPE